MPEPIPVAPPPRPIAPPQSGGGISEPWHGAPKWVWILGGTIVLFVGYRWWRGKKSAGSTTSQVGMPQGVTSPLPGWTGLGNELGPLGGSSPSGPLIGYDNQGNPIYGLPGQQPGANGGGSVWKDPGGQLINGPPGQPIPAQPSAGSPVANKFTQGQIVNARSGETIVSEVYSPVYGWLDETNKGGIYTGGGGSQPISGLPNGGSYLGYVQRRFGVNTPAAQQEMALHGSFGQGGLKLLPGGGYEEINSRGETYRFGS